jgi:hypothetical protein
MPPGRRVPAFTTLGQIGEEESSASSKKASVLEFWGGGGHLGEGKQRLVEHNMTRDDDPVRVEVETSISLMVRGIPEENTQG